MSTFRQDPEDRDSARVAADMRTLRQRVSTGQGKRRPTVKVESIDRELVSRSANSSNAVYN